MEVTEFLGVLAPVLLAFIATLSWVVKRVLAIFDKQLDRANNSVESMTKICTDLTLEMREGNRLTKDAIKRLDKHLTDTHIHLRAGDAEALKELKGP